jgi:hypothetical protein
MTRAAGHKRGAVLLRVDGALQFLPASTAVHVGPVPRVTPLPGAPPELIGVAIHEGTIVPVVSIGAARAEMVVCQHAGEVLGVIGGQVVRTGLFDVAPGRPEAIVHEGKTAEAVDLTTIYARIQTSSRPGRWGG